MLLFQLMWILIAMVLSPRCRGKKISVNEEGKNKEDELLREEILN